MRVQTFVDEAAANGDTDVELYSAYEGQNEAIVQIEITGTASCQILGRLTPDFSWVEVVPAVTANTIQPITFMPELRATISGYSSGSVSVAVLSAN